MSHADAVPTGMNLTREIVNLLRALDDFKKLRSGEPWWESPEYQALMERKTELVARLRLIDGAE